MSKTFEFSLEDDSARMAQERARACGFDSVSTYVTHLVSMELEGIDLPADFESKLLRSLASPAVPMDAHWIEERLTKLREVLREEAV